MNCLRIFFLSSIFFSFIAVARADVPRYDISANVDLDKRVISAHQRVTFTNPAEKPVSEIYFHIYANRRYTLKEKAFMLRFASYFKVVPPPQGFEEARMDVTRISANGNQLSYGVEGKDDTLLKVTLDHPLAKGESITLDMDFTTSIPIAFGRFGTLQKITAISRWYPILSVYDEQGWENHPFYPFHRPFHSEAAHYNVDLTVPANQTVASSANIVNETIESDHKTLHIETAQPIRDFALAVSDQYEIAEEEHEGVTFKAYYLPGHEAKARESIANAHSLMSFYTKQFGPYPYKTFSIAPVHLGYGGEQMSNLIFIDTRVFDLPKLLNRYFDLLIAHETGHQWFYNQVGVNNSSQMWLEEGVNSYFLLKYLEDKYGYNATILDEKQLPKWAKMFIPELTFRKTRDVRYKIAVRQGYDRPIISNLSSFNEPSSIFALTYGKGSRVVDMLRTKIGDEAFGHLFRRIFKEYQFKNIDIKDFMRLAQEESRMDLTAFFDQWLFSKKTLDAKVTKVAGNKVTLQRKGGIVAPVDVGITYKDGRKENRSWEGSEDKAILKLDDPIKNVSLDPDHKLLDLDRTNNTWPRAVRTHLVPLYHPLYDISALMPDDQYNLVIGPEISNGLGIKSSFQKPYDYKVIAATDYDFSEQIQRSRAGVEVYNVAHSQTMFGAEEMITNDYDTGEDDLVSQKVFLRRELWPVPSGLFEVNDHATLYAIHNRTPQSSLFSEDVRNTSYLKRNESIVGALVHFDRSRPRLDPQEGYSIDTLVENSGHWAGATQAFTRASIDTHTFHPVTPRSKMAYRLKYGWGSSDDKNLYELGGSQGLRGFDRKTLRGSDMLLGTAEYRFPLLDDLNASVADHWLTLTRVSGVAFVDSGQVWRESFNTAKFHSDAGAGLRFHISIGSMLENVIFRVDAAHAIDEPKESTHYWFGIDHAF
jgi:hypothetical protein